MGVIHSIIKTVIAIIADDSGVSINEIMSKTSKSNATVKRYLNILKTIDLIEFKGATKTGKF
ncbi:MAG: winged helix-turn-helix transcriptional regulator [Bacteroidales bacterium]|nr:winged helix-turn-helix transcriptional regulator [Bacteroidales bacterium]